MVAGSGSREGPERRVWEEGATATANVTETLNALILLFGAKRFDEQK